MDIGLLKGISEVEDITDSIFKLFIEEVNDEETHVLKEIPENGDFEDTSMPSAHQSDDSFSLPDHELAEKILKQVEYFFSDDDIWKDKFLLKHILRNNEGYVNIQLLSSLMQVHALTEDWKVVAQSLKNSDKLEMNEDMSKVRRINPLSDIENTVNSGSVMVFEIPSKVKTSDDVKDLLKSFGPVTHASLMSSNSDSLSPHMKRRLSFYKHISSTIFAVAKFQSAEDSVEAIKHVPNLEQAFIVVPLINEDYSKISPSPSPNDHERDSEHSLPMSDDNKGADGSYETPSPSKYESTITRRSRRYRNNCTPFPNSTRNVSEDCQPTVSCRYKSDSSINPWKLRRQLSCCCDAKKRVIAIRQPRGPDGTIGFHAGRSEMSLSSVKLCDFEI